MEITIDPVTRLEGHHGVKINVDGGVVTDAKALALMFRGFERLLVGRDIRDAPIITQRICGVCHNDHRLASLMAIENAAGIADEWNVGIPPAAMAYRNLVAALQYVYDHPVWVYVLAGPDFSDSPHGTGLTRLNPILGKGVKEAVWAQRELHKAMAIIGGKVPHMMTPAPGGMTLEIDEKVITQLVGKIADVKKWAVGVGIGQPAATNAEYVLDEVLRQLEDIKAGKRDEFEPKEGMGNALFDMLAMIAVAHDMGLNEQGVWEDSKMLAYGFLPDPESGELYFPGGFYNGSELENLDYRRISEDTTYAWYKDETQTGYVGTDLPPEPYYGKPNAYTWGKAPRYDGWPAEVGPLPRLVAMYFKKSKELGDPLGLRKTFCGSPTVSTALSRMIARIQEELIMIDYLENLLLQLKDYAGKKTAIEFPKDVTGEGVGLREAPRGALGHWVVAEKGKIKRYQAVVPTTWNVSPMDSKGQHGPLESALIGTTVSDPSNPWEVIRVIHSFDLCLACTVHVFTKEGKKTSITLDACSI